MTNAGDSRLISSMTCRARAFASRLEWYTDEAEPNSIVVRGVVPTSPADRAGLENADRIVPLDGGSVGLVRDPAEFFRRGSATMTLGIERHGQYKSIRLVTPPARPDTASATESPRRDDTRDRRDR